MANINSMSLPFPATAPTSGQTIDLFTLTGKQARDARRLLLVINTSSDSATNGISYQALLDNGTTYREFTNSSYLTASGVNTFRIALPGTQGLKVTYHNSANTLSPWEGSITILYDEIASP